MAGAVMATAFQDGDDYYKPHTAMWPTTRENRWCCDWLPREAGDGGE